MSSRESGFALLLTLIAVFLLSFLGLFLSLNANTGVKISDNYETQIQATYAALAGLNHARVLVRGLRFDDLLKGPDGFSSGDLSYLAAARQFDFRNLLPLSTFCALDISNPSVVLPMDDGLISTGFYNGAAGMVLIPAAGIALSAESPYGAGQIITSRYFVKITDNNGDLSEICGDPVDDPFADGDGIVIVRSVGLSRTFTELTGTAVRLNSAVVFEVRFKRISAFDAGPALLVLGSDVDARFGGTYEISGGAAAGIGTVDTDVSDSSLPDQILTAAAGTGGRITGGGQPVPSIRDSTIEVFAGCQTSDLMDPRFLWDFVNVRAAKFADYYASGSQNWSSGAAPYTGFYDPGLAWNAPGQDPKITVVNGDLSISGDYSGGGLLVVTGSLSYTGSFTFRGLVLVIGSGNLAADGSGQGLQGGLIIASLHDQSGNLVFGRPSISINGSSRFQANREAVRMAMGLIPVSQTSFREIAGTDP